MHKVENIWEDAFPDEEYRRGYASVLKSGCTGVRPETFTLANGVGRNCKGVITEHTVNVCGEYAIGEAHLALLTKPWKSGANPEMAGLHRKRLTVFSEPEDGLSEPIRLSAIKKLTGNPIANARMCHSNNTKTELNGTVMMECNKLPLIVGDKGESATARIRFFPFVNVFTENENLHGKPTKDGGIYKPMDKGLKSDEMKERLRCAWFMYLMRNGGDAPWFPERTKELGRKYLADNDDLSIWFLENYEECMSEPIMNFVSIKEMWHQYTSSNNYLLMDREERKMMNQRRFTDDIKSNPVTGKWFREPKKVSVVAGGVKMQNGKAGVIHFRRKIEEESDWVEPPPESEGKPEGEPLAEP
jgi:phage/plasmid-associated DNA primase